MHRMHALLINLQVLVAPMAFAQEGTGGLFQFFGGADIDYWREGKRVRDGLSIAGTPTPSETPVPGREKASSFSGSTLVREADAKPFSWDSYRNVRAPEFWDDGGDWIPPRPFREAAANPTQENITQYLDWQVRKTHVVNRFQEALTLVGSKQSSQRKETQSEGPSPSFSWRTLRVAYFYQSSCGHCRNSAPVVEKAQSLGAKVTFVQLDAGANPPLHRNSIAYDAAWAKSFPISSTPTWVLKVQGATETVTGELSLEKLARHATSLASQRKDK